MLLDEVNITAEASVPIEEIDRIFAVDLLSNQLFIDVIPLLGLNQTVVDEKLADFLCSHAVYIVEVLFSYKFLSSEVTLLFLPPAVAHWLAVSLAMHPCPVDVVLVAVFF